MLAVFVRLREEEGVVCNVNLEPCGKFQYLVEDARCRWGFQRAAVPLHPAADLVVDKWCTCMEIDVVY